MPRTDVSAQTFWDGLAQVIETFGPLNRELLAERDRLQTIIDDWLREHSAQPHDPVNPALLLEIGYLVPDGPRFTIDTNDVDAEIAQIAGPQLVVPVSNARYALNAANARWGSLYDALYGTDVIPDESAPRGGKYNPERGAKVIAFARDFLDRHFALADGSHRDTVRYQAGEDGLNVELNNGRTTRLRDSAAFSGFQGDRSSPTALLLKHHGLHVELHIDRAHYIGRGDPAGISDVVLESAITTIQDCEDSVAAVDAEDKIHVYRNWLGLMKGDLTARVEKGRNPIIRRLNADRQYQTPGGQALVLPGRSLMLVRNVGHHMLSNVATLSGSPIPETFIDAAVTVLIASHDLRAGAQRNSRTGSVYVVKPKMHGPDEVRFADELFGAVEELLDFQETP